MNKVLRKLEKGGLRVKLSKREWFVSQVEFLVHSVSENGLKKSESLWKKK